MKKNEEIWLHTQNPLRFRGFTFVIIVFVEIRDDFHDFVSECVSFQRKINNLFWGHRFSKEKWQFSLDVKQNTHFTDENQR